MFFPFIYVFESFPSCDTYIIKNAIIFVKKNIASCDLNHILYIFTDIFEKILKNYLPNIFLHLYIKKTTNNHFKGKK